jgi:hypothetical protein
MVSPNLAALIDLFQHLLVSHCPKRVRGRVYGSEIYPDTVVRADNGILAILIAPNGLDRVAHVNVTRRIRVAYWAKHLGPLNRFVSRPSSYRAHARNRFQTKLGQSVINDSGSVHCPTNFLRNLVFY